MNIKKNKGFVILFAVTLSAIILAIALSVASIAEQEIKFGTSAKDTNEAFFAADTGIECALVNDKSVGSVFVHSVSPSLTCNNTIVTATENPSLFWSFTLSGLGSAGTTCTKVTIDKTTPPTTTIIANGYNFGDAGCNSSSPNRVERELKTSYDQS